MIPNQWYAVLSSSEVKRGRPAGVTRFGRRLVFWRDEDGNVACLDGTCCHRGADLAAGRVEGGHRAGRSRGRAIAEEDTMQNGKMV